LLDGLQVGLRRAIQPRGVGFQYGLYAVAVLFSDLQWVHPGHEVPVDARVAGVVRLAVAAAFECDRERATPANAGVLEITDGRTVVLKEQVIVQDLPFEL